MYKDSTSTPSQPAFRIGAQHFNVEREVFTGTIRSYPSLKARNKRGKSSEKQAVALKLCDFNPLVYLRLPIFDHKKKLRVTFD